MTGRTMIGKVHDDVLILKEDVKYIKKCLDGNGKCGLIEKVDNHESFIDSLKGQLNLGAWLIGGGVLFSAIGVAVTLWQIFH